MLLALASTQLCVCGRTEGFIPTIVAQKERETTRNHDPIKWEFVYRTGLTRSGFGKTSALCFL